MIWLILVRSTAIVWAGLRFFTAFALTGISGFVGRLSLTEVLSARAHALTALLEKAGGAFIKFGQLLAMRPDFLPAEYISPLSRLPDDIEPFPTKVAQQILEYELGKKVGEIFSEFPEKPQASASFGQVYKARLKTGEFVAVKIQRPKIRDQVKVDLVQLFLNAVTPASTR